MQRVSRQAISAITQELEGLGYLERRPDPRDRRGVVLGLSRAGEALIRDSVAACDAMEARFGRLIGARRLGQLARGAHELYHALHLEEEIFEPQPAARARPDVQRLARRLRRRLDAGERERLATLLGRRAQGATT